MAPTRKTKEKSVLPAVDVRTDGNEKTPADKILEMMVANKIQRIDLDYSGGGDDGTVDATEFVRTENGLPELSEGIKDELDRMCSDLLFKLNPEIDFNNDGCSGNAVFIIVDEKLLFQCYHTTYYTEERNSTIDREISDASLL